MRPQMTEEEIRRDYRLAKWPDYQIGVLADLNCTTRKVILRILGGESWGEAVGAARMPARAAVLGDARQRAYHSNKAWTLQEEDELERMYREGASYDELREAFGRTKKAIAAKLDRLGLARRRKRRTAYDADTS